MVPHYQCDVCPCLEQIASTVSQVCGVILLSSDREFTESFIATQNNPDHFTIVTAPLDTPWIHDRSPIALKTSTGFEWISPNAGMPERKHDNKLFDLISANPIHKPPIKHIAHGNLIAGAKGLAFATRQILIENKLSLGELNNHKHSMGISHWEVFPEFKNEQSGHADVHVRVLKPKLFAVAWNLSVKNDREKINKLINQIKKIQPGATVLKIPVRSKGKLYASLVNWIQIGKHLIIPRFPMTKQTDVIATKCLLEKYGFKVKFIYSPTTEQYGSLHCLTASIFT